MDLSARPVRRSEVRWVHASELVIWGAGSAIFVAYMGVASIWTQDPSM